jgi:hypothetical protein
MTQLFIKIHQRAGTHRQIVVPLRNYTRIPQVPVRILAGLLGTLIGFMVFISTSMNEGRLQSSWTHIITPSRNFVEVR